MSLGRRKREKQQAIWIDASAIAKRGGHPFYERLDELLGKREFDRFAEDTCATFYSHTGRPGLAPGVYFRLPTLAEVECRRLLIGYFEGIDSERGIAWRAGDSLAIREFLGYELSEGTPDHTTISRTRRLIDIETHREIFG
jgi:transposase